MSKTDHGLPGIYNASPFTSEDGTGSALATDVHGNIKSTAVNSSNTIINPATEEKQDDILTALGGAGAITTNTPSIKSDATALVANASRKGWEIQNLGTNPLFVLKGNGASTTVFHKVLGASQSNDDGTGGNYSETFGRIYTGIITVAGTSPRYVITEYA